MKFLDPWKQCRTNSKMYVKAGHWSFILRESLKKKKKLFPTPRVRTIFLTAELCSSKELFTLSLKVYLFPSPIFRVGLSYFWLFLGCPVPEPSLQRPLQAKAPSHLDSHRPSNLETQNHIIAHTTSLNCSHLFSLPTFVRCFYPQIERYLHLFFKKIIDH